MASSKDGWANLVAGGQPLRTRQPEVDSRNWGYAKLSELVRATGQLTVEQMATGHRVRIIADVQ
jgi:hypothetical protein